MGALARDREPPCAFRYRSMVDRGVIQPIFSRAGGDDRTKWRVSPFPLTRLSVFVVIEMHAYSLEQLSHHFCNSPCSPNLL